MATTIHFTYPVLAMLAGMLTPGGHMNAPKLVGCVFILAGTLVVVAATKETPALKTPVPAQPNP